MQNNEAQYEKLQKIDLSDPKNASEIQPFHDCQVFRQKEWYKKYLQDTRAPVFGASQDGKCTYSIK